MKKLNRKAAKTLFGLAFESKVKYPNTPIKVILIMTKKK